LNILHRKILTSGRVGTRDNNRLGPIRVGDIIPALKSDILKSRELGDAGYTYGVGHARPVSRVVSQSGLQVRVVLGRENSAHVLISPLQFDQVKSRMKTDELSGRPVTAPFSI
jgi:hypothetical protein